MKISCKLGDIIELNYGKSLPEKIRNNGKIPVYGSSGRAGSHDEYLIEGPGIIVGRKGNVGSVYWEKDNFFPIDTTYYITVKDKQKINIKYVFYLLKTLNLNKLNADSAVPGLNRNHALGLPVKIFSKKTQEEIVSYLSPYDELISKNSIQIQLLKQASFLLYEEWFIRFRFPGHELTRVVDGLPEGWKKRSLGEIVTLKYGKALKAEDRLDGEIPVYGSSGIVGYHNQAIIKGPSIVVGRKGNVGSIYWSQSDFYPIDTVYYIDASHASRYLYYSLKNLVFHSSDSAVPGLNRDYAHRQILIYPQETIIHHFEETTKDLFNQILHLQIYNQKLVQARDLLLPKLMNGEIQL